jgi:hypothetical protein
MTLLIRPDGAQMVAMPQTKNPGFHPWEHALLLIGDLAAATYHGDHYRIKVAVTPPDGGGPPQHLEFHLPAFGHGVTADIQRANLPAIGAPIALSLTHQAATLLPFASSPTA